MHKNRDGIREAISFGLGAAIRMLLPPLLNLPRLERYCRKRMAANPRACGPRRFLAELYRDNRKYDDARREYEEMVKLDCAEDRDLFNLAEVCVWLHDFQRVVWAISEAAERHPEDKKANSYLGLSYAALGDYPSGIVYLEKAVAAGSTEYDTYWHLGYCLDRVNQLDKARVNYEKALSLRPDSAELRSNLGSVYIRIGQSVLASDRATARAAFKKALYYLPHDAKAMDLIEKLDEIERCDRLTERLSSPHSSGGKQGG